MDTPCFTRCRPVYLLLSLFIMTWTPVHAATDCAQVSTIPQSDCEALLTLYYHTAGSTWYDAADNAWNTTTDPCFWTGVTCSGGRITGLFREHQNLQGTLPDLNLSALRWLYLGNNLLSGAIPDFSNLPALTRLYLYNNRFSGSIPDFRHLPALDRLYLYNNQLEGRLPDFSHLPVLTELILGSNRLTGIIPNFTHLPALNSLWLRHNLLSGQIPDFNYLPDLKKLYLNANQLSGTVPHFSAFDLASLEALSLTGNCGLNASDANQENLLQQKDPDWLLRNSLCTKTNDEAADNFPAIFTQPAYAFAENSGRVSIILKRRNCLAETAPALDLDYQFKDDSAIFGNDYIAAAGKIHWPARTCGEQSISLELINDNIYEAYESFFVSIEGDAHADYKQSVLVITDGDDQSLPANTDPDTGLHLAADGTLIDPVTALAVDINGNLDDTAKHRKIDPFSYLPVDANATYLVFNAQSKRLEPFTGSLENEEGMLIDPDTEAPLDTSRTDLVNLLINQRLEHLHPAALNKMEKILNRLFPPVWRIDSNTGEIFPPPNTPLDIPPRKNPQRPFGLEVNLPDFSRGIAVAGSIKGGSILDEINAFFASVGRDCTASQNDDGLLPIECDGLKLSFAPGRARQAPANSEPGLVRNENGDYVITTGKNREFIINAAPKDLRSLVAVLAIGVELGRDGVLSLYPFDTLASPSTSSKNSVDAVGFQQHLRVDAKQRENIYNEAAGLYIDSDTKGHLVYPGNTVQDVTPTVPNPQTFLSLARRFPGISKALYQSDGSFRIIFQEQLLKLLPQFNPRVRELRSDEKVEPVITSTPDSSLTYTVQYRNREVTTVLVPQFE